MTTDLACLVGVGVLSIVLALVPGASRTQRGGIAWGLGNRDRSPGDDPAWVGRAERAHRNLLENLPLFTILVLVAHVSGRHDTATALASEVFLAARIAHAAVYVAGVTVVRTLAFYVGLVAELVVLWRIVA